MRQGNNPKRRLAPYGRLDEAERRSLAERLTYTGSALHKRQPGDYGFTPPFNPRPWKSLCDGARAILLAEAQALLRQGVMLGLFSDFPDGGQPKYVWAMAPDGDVFEAKIDSTGYHGYRLEEEDDFRPLIRKEWNRRCGPG